MNPCPHRWKTIWEKQIVGSTIYLGAKIMGVLVNLRRPRNLDCTCECSNAPSISISSISYYPRYPICSRDHFPILASQLLLFD